MNKSFPLFWKRSVVMAEPFKNPGILEASIVGGVGTAAFVTISPWAASSLGGYLACQSVGCAVGTSVAGGFSGGFSASLLTLGTGTGLYQIRYKKWLRDNAGKYVVNNAGKLQQLPALAFVVPVVSPLNPFCAYLLVNSYCFYKGYKEKLKELDSVEEKHTMTRSIKRAL